MVTQTILKQEELPSSQADFRGVLTTPNGGAVRLLPGEERLAGRTPPPSGPSLEGRSDERAAGETAVLEGALVAATRRGNVELPVTNLVEMAPRGGMTLTYVDRAETISLRIVPEAEFLNAELRYVGKPLAEALASARFFDALMGDPGQLVFEARLPGEGGGTVGERFEIGELPLPMPEPKREAHRGRLEVLEALHEILLATGVEIRYPEDSRGGDDGLGNLNFVLKAIRGGWVASSVDGFTTHLAPAEVRVLAEELGRDGEVGRAFLFELPEEAHEVFGTRVNLGPSRRYVAAAKLTTGRKEIEAWLGSGPGSETRLDLFWEPMNGIPMHVFFEDWPKTTLGSVERELRELEAVYGVDTEGFVRGRESGEAWVGSIQDAARWLALAQAREELGEEPGGPR